MPDTTLTPPRRSGPVPSLRTQTRTMTMPATASFCTLMWVMRFSSSSTVGRCTEATPTSTVPSRASSSTQTELGSIPHAFVPLWLQSSLTSSWPAQGATPSLKNLGQTLQLLRQPKGRLLGLERTGKRRSQVPREEPFASCIRKLHGKGSRTRKAEVVICSFAWSWGAAPLAWAQRPRKRKRSQGGLGEKEQKLGARVDEKTC